MIEIAGVGLQSIPTFESIEVATIGTAGAIATTLMVAVMIYVTWVAMEDENHQPNLDDTDTPYDHSTGADHAPEHGGELEGETEAEPEPEAEPEADADATPV